MINGIGVDLVDKVRFINLVKKVYSSKIPQFPQYLLILIIFFYLFILLEIY